MYKAEAGKVLLLYLERWWDAERWQFCINAFLQNDRVLIYCKLNCEETCRGESIANFPYSYPTNAVNIFLMMFIYDLNIIMWS